MTRKHRRSPSFNPFDPFAELRPAIQQISTQIQSELLDDWGKKIECYRPKEIEQQQGLFVEKHAALTQEFKKRGIDYKRHIFPIFMESYIQFIVRLSLYKAGIKSQKKFRKWLKRYQGPVQVITEDGAPFSEELKLRLKDEYSLLPGHLGKELMVIIERQQAGLLDRNIEKSPHKHPIWMDLQVKLFKILTGKGVSERQTYFLIDYLFRTLIPQWFDVAHGQDTIRQNVKRRLKAKP